MNSLEKLKNIKSIKGTSLKDIVAGKFPRLENRIRSYKRTSQRLAGQRRYISGEIIKVNQQTEEINKELPSLNETERFQKERQLRELEAQRQRLNGELESINAQLQETNTDIADAESDLKKAQVASKTAKEELISKFAPPGAGFLFKNRKKIMAGLIIFTSIFVMLVIIILYSAQRLQDNPGLGLEAVFNAQCLDTTDPECMVKYLNELTQTDIDSRLN